MNFLHLHCVYTVSNCSLHVRLVLAVIRIRAARGHQLAIQPPKQTRADRTTHLRRKSHQRGRREHRGCNTSATTQNAQRKHTHLNQIQQFRRGHTAGASQLCAARGAVDVDRDREAARRGGLLVPRRVGDKELRADLWKRAIASMPQSRG